MAGEIEVQVKDKFCLTIDEASEYFKMLIDLTQQATIS